MYSGKFRTLQEQDLPRHTSSSTTKREREAIRIRDELEGHRFVIEQYNKSYAAALFMRNDSIVRTEKIRLILEKERQQCNSLKDRLEELEE